ncbi:hypothetical protein Nepgr_009692 [Nepenthes gracilis]|uniref:Uncharacterized protein n=1 Tax=Nepenthes gracilis TaxID=150966 RepID=A0AAD3SB77_NEPGR|nr:hypothetical protein Nepgr_009692 [Nepenthes gracilis]
MAIIKYMSLDTTMIQKLVLQCSYSATENSAQINESFSSGHGNGSVCGHGSVFRIGINVSEDKEVCLRQEAEQVLALSSSRNLKKEGKCLDILGSLLLLVLLQ